jgi:hypothetical protein
VAIRLTLSVIFNKSTETTAVKDVHVTLCILSCDEVVDLTYLNHPHSCPVN